MGNRLPAEIMDMVRREQEVKPHGLMTAEEAREHRPRKGRSRKRATKRAERNRLRPTKPSETPSPHCCNGLHHRIHHLFDHDLTFPRYHAIHVYQNRTSSISSLL